MLANLLNKTLGTAQELNSTPSLQTFTEDSFASLDTEDFDHSSSSASSILYSIFSSFSNIGEELSDPTAAETDYVVNISFGGISKTLKVSIDQPPDKAGNTLSTAYSFGVLSGTQAVSDWVDILDPQDVYSFSLSQESNFDLDISGLNGNVNLQLIKDLNNNDQVDTNEVWASAVHNESTDESTNLSLGAGTYFVRVTPQIGVNTDYTLTLSATLIAPELPEPEPGGMATHTLTGNTAIDALLGDSGQYWDLSSNGRVATYSFLSSTASADYYGSEIVSEVSEEVKNRVREILTSLESIIDVDFVEVADTASSYGVLRYMYSDGPSSYAYAYLPESDPIGGDIHLTPMYEDNPDLSFSAGPGSYGYQTLIHETFHALGLKHSGQYSNLDVGPFLSPEEDNNTNTVMSYNDAGAYASTPMSYDIRALQSLYGAKSYRETDTTYSFSTVDGYTVDSQFFGSTTALVKQTVWDSAGTDTFDFSGLAASALGYRFDLREGGLLTTQEAYNASSYTDLTTGEAYTTSSYGTAIAYGAVFENVINSTSNDYIIANNAANTFSGYNIEAFTGNDIIESTSFADVLDLSSYNLFDLTTTVEGSDLTLGLGANGSIAIKNYYGETSPIKALVAGSYYTYAASEGWLLTPADEVITLPVDQVVTPPADQVITLPADQVVTSPADQVVTSPADQVVTLPTEMIVSTDEPSLTEDAQPVIESRPCSCPLCTGVPRINTVGDSSLSQLIETI